MEGQILGNRYLLLEKIGGGGMAVVYKAKCTLLNRFVAIKVLRSEFTNDEEFVKRFKVEAQAVASLSHPNVVSIYDVGHQEDIHYIVMEYVDGMTLKEFINKHGAINWQDAVKITIQICSAIEHAHKNNIVHRDIKPHNILLTKEGIAKVTDFGIARAVTSSTITMVGSTIGSVHYFSPEQARGGFIDEKSDLYSLGIALYEMVTGKVPFDGDTPVSVALKHIQEMPVEPHKLVPSLPYGVNEIIMKAIQKEQNVRYQSATSMINDLNRVLVQPQGGFVGRDNINGQSTIRMKPVNSSRSSNEARSNEYSNKQNELKKEKKKTNLTYWLAGITSVVVIVFVVIMAISLLTKGDNTEPYKLDNYVGREYEAVKAELEGKGFKITPTWQESQTIAKGMIIDQSIPPGTDYKSGNYTSLELTVSSGRKMSKVPEVKDREYREAQKEMESSNLKSRIEKEFNDDIETDYVIRTEPAAGEEVDEGTEVIIYVSKGKETKRIKVPNLVGKNEEEAQKALADNKLQLGTIIPAGAKGIVNKQLPTAYTEVEEGETVTIWLTVEQAPSTDTAQQSQPSDTSGGKDTETQGPSDTSQPSLPVDNQNKNTGNEGN